ncbi:MAG: quinoprotein glucose dehydrogenase [Candidatus Pelagisphaera sp.]|jgi:quinoprotein glucose dehydrogenase
MKLLQIATPVMVLAGIFGGSSVISAEKGEDLSDTLSFTKWSGDLVVPDPISISMDDQGRAYVTQTQRRKAQDLDIRNNRDWIPDDVGFDSVEAKRQFYRSQLSTERSAENTGRVEDYNKDGVHDYRDMMVMSEKIFLLEDTDGDGTADSIDLYAEDFKSEVTGIAAGVLWYEGDVYSTIAPDVWKLRDTDGDDVADEREIMATGFGLHIAYGGHDMHGLIVGPDGKMYWSIGDKGINAMTKEGKRFYYPNQGGVMRCNPDGSDFEVFAHGLRNVQEFDFDDYGNWFGVDNDSDQKGEMERFVYIVEGMDAGWRCNYQYRKDGYNPWMAEGLSVPVFEGQAAYIVPAIQNYVDGPAGFVFNPGTALNPGYKDYFFLNSTMGGVQYAFQVEQNGASFVMKNDHKIGAGTPLIGLTVGPDGALYAPDWGGGYPLNKKGAVWKIDDSSGADRSVREEVAALIAEGFDKTKTRQLRTYLGHVDRRIRLNAQFELVKRGETKVLVAESKTGARLKRIHAVWGLGQLARKDDALSIKTLLGLLGDKDSEIQVQSSKVLADLDIGTFDGGLLTPLLTSKDPRVRFQAGLAIGNHRVSSAFNDVVSMIADNDGGDLYLRHAGIVALEGIGGAERLANHSSKEARLSAVVALRRNRSSEVAVFLKDRDAEVVREAARAIHDDLSIPEALSSLAAALERLDSSDAALSHRIINANLRLGGAGHAGRVARIATDKSLDSALRIEAVESITNWVEPPLLDRVDGRRRELGIRDEQSIARAVGPALNELLSSKDGKLLETVVAAASRLNVELKPDAMLALLKNQQASSQLRMLALKNLNTKTAIDYALKSDLDDLRVTAAGMLVGRDPVQATRILGEQLVSYGSIQQAQSALASLAQIESPEADKLIENFAKGEFSAGLRLDVLEAAAKRGFKDVLSAFDSKRDSSDPIGAFVECLEGGDVRSGEEIVNTHLGAQCIRCHRVSSASGSKIGPNLKNIGQKERSYLLRSLVDPGADIAKGFGMVSVSLDDGSTVSGLLGSETGDTLEILSLDGSSKLIDKTKVASQTDPISTMPPVGLMLTKRELRDVIAFLSGLDE